MTTTSNPTFIHLPTNKRLLRWLRRLRHRLSTNRPRPTTPHRHTDMSAVVHHREQASAQAQFGIAGVSPQAMPLPRPPRRRP